ncbi:MAG: hypothetical protein ACXADY_20560 [Candidatus Hodarchaeales archaeon]|jgi:DNA-binding transcriptional regulator GbsR (MarR family)
MSNKRAHLLTGKLKAYEKQLVAFFIALGGSRGQGEKESTISGYGFVHKKLTAKQLRDLTGYSIGTISSYFRTFYRSGFLKKRRLSGSHTYEYYLPHQSIFYLSDLLRHENLSKASLLQEFCKTLRSKTKQYSYLDSRLADFITYLDIHKDFFSELQVDDSEASHDFLPSPTPNYVLDPDLSTLEGIEKEFQDFILELEFFPIRYDSVAKILCYYILRGQLNQREIQQLTGLSAGSVSQGLTTLMNLGLLTKSSSPSSRQYVFEMKSVTKGILRYSEKIIDEALSWKPTLQQIRDTLDTQYDDLNTKPGYIKIYTTTTQFLRLLPAYERMKTVIQSYL